LILIDEASLLSSETIAVFQEFIDGTFPMHEFEGTKASLNRAIFIFITDYGVEGYTEGMTYQEMEEATHMAALSQWRDIKQLTLVHYVVPFKPLSRQGVGPMIRKLIKRLPGNARLRERNIKLVLVVSDVAFSNLENYLYSICKQDKNVFRNYRCIEDQFSTDIEAQVIGKLISQEDMVINCKITVSGASSQPQVTITSKYPLGKEDT